MRRAIKRNHTQFCKSLSTPFQTRSGRAPQKKIIPPPVIRPRGHKRNDRSGHGLQFGQECATADRPFPPEHLGFHEACVRNPRAEDNRAGWIPSIKCMPPQKRPLTRPGRNRRGLCPAGHQQNAQHKKTSTVKTGDEHLKTLRRLYDHKQKNVYSNAKNIQNMLSSKKHTQNLK